MRRVLLLLLALYKRVISPILPAACRFHPTCSVYAAEAIRRHGALAGTRLTVARLLRCRPGGGFGDDPVPDVVSPRRGAGAPPPAPQPDDARPAGGSAAVPSASAPSVRAGPQGP